MEFKRIHRTHIINQDLKEVEGYCSILIMSFMFNWYSKPFSSRKMFVKGNLVLEKGDLIFSQNTKYAQSFNFRSQLNSKYRLKQKFVKEYGCSKVIWQ